MRQSLLITAAATLLLGGCITVYASGGETITQNRDLPAFEQVEASRGVSLTLSCGSSAKAVLHGDAEEVANIDLHVEGRTLIARRNSSWSGHHGAVHIDVTTVQALDRLQVSSGALIEAQSCAISPERLNLEASSGGEVKLAGRTGRLTADASSGGTITRLDSGRIDAQDAQIRVSSGGSVRVCSVGHLDGHASSGGSISSEQAGSGERSASSGGDFSTRRCD